MEQLKSTLIRGRIHDLCEFCLALVKGKSLHYDAGLDQDGAIRELEAILKDVEGGSDFTIAFVGEYSSGKTTIVNQLTDTCRHTGTDVTTEEACKLRWNDVWIVDTPGLGSGRTEHDKKTELWLTSADLLVYVLTADLLGTEAGKRLLEMLDRYQREHEMMIVLNMIDKEGNDISVYREELQCALGHRPLDDYYPTFISAKDKEKSREPQQSAERRERLAVRSRFNTFVANLNIFVLHRKERASLTTPLTRLQVLMRKIRFDAEYHKEEILLNLRMAVFEKTQKAVKHASCEFREDMNDCVNSTASTIFDALGDPPSDFDAFCQGRMDDFRQNCDDVIARLAGRLEECLAVLQGENISLDQTPLAQEVLSRIEGSPTLQEVFRSLPTPDSDTGGTLPQFVSSLREFAKTDGANLPQEWKSVLGAPNAISAASMLVGMVNRDLILTVGRGIGYKFRPWQAVKLSARFTQAVPLLNLAAAAWEFESRRREKKREEEAALQLRQFKTDVKAMLRESADKIIGGVSQYLTAHIEKLLASGLESLKEKKMKLATYLTEHRDASKELEMKRAQCMFLYDEIYGAGKTEG